MIETKERVQEQVVATLQQGARLVSVFGAADANVRRVIRYIVDVAGEYRVFTDSGEGEVPSITPACPAAAWHEREARELYGIDITGHPDPRPLVMHDDFMPEAHPPTEFYRRSAREPYRFLEVSGTGLCEVAVGPVHAGIIEPGHFRFSVVGDRVIHLELRHFYTHKGTERLFEGISPDDAAPIAESVSGDNCFSHAVAYSQAVEAAYGVCVPPRAEAIRAVGLELERMLAHIGDFGALCGDVGFVLPAAAASGMKEALLRASTYALGTRYWRGVTMPGGLRRDLDDSAVLELAKAVRTVHTRFASLAHEALETASVQNRFEQAGVLAKEVAQDLAVVGPVARASGIATDVRRDHPSGAYRRLSFEVPTTHYGDVMARARMRVAEAGISARLIAELLASLPAGPVFSRGDFRGSGNACSSVESPRGELLYWIESRDGRIARCHLRSPSFQNWPALPLAVADNVIADFPLINKSFNLSYSGCDR
jgi:Ni,Fe-hydrogenase III large subunit/Ni,Fe-hydrogenase III component G